MNAPALGAPRALRYRGARGADVLMPPALMFRVTGTVLHYEPSRGRVWAEAFTKLVWASSDIDATSGIEKETNDSENDDCYGLAAVRVGEVPA